MRVRTAKDLGELVRAARRSRRLSQHDLAEAAGVSRRWLIEFEAGKPRAELALVLRVLETLGMPLHAGPDDSSAAPTPLSVFDLDEHLRRIAEPG